MCKAYKELVLLNYFHYFKIQYLLEFALLIIFTKNQVNFNFYQ